MNALLAGTFLRVRQNVGMNLEGTNQEVIPVLETPEAPKPIKLQNFTSGIQTGRHLLSLPETQESHTEALEFQQDVVHSGVGVAGQQHAEAAGVKDANLRAEAGA